MWEGVIHWEDVVWLPIFLGIILAGLGIVFVLPVYLILRLRRNGPEVAKWIVTPDPKSQFTPQEQSMMKLLFLREMFRR